MNTNSNTTNDSMPSPLGYNPAAIHDAARSLILSTVSNNTSSNNSSGVTTTTANTTNADGSELQEQPTTSATVVPLAEAEGNPLSLCRATYKECQRNFAASLGQLAHDGCGEFMLLPGVPPGCTDPEQLKCAACNCHRNFHRAVDRLDGGLPQCACHGWRAEDRALLQITPGEEEAGRAGNNTPTGGGATPTPRKRFRTKFTPEQKARMTEFAHRVGWKMTRDNDTDIQRFCDDVNVQRNVFKIWMHNNKNSLGGKRDSTTTQVCVLFCFVSLLYLCSLFVSKVRKERERCTSFYNRSLNHLSLLYKFYSKRDPNF